MGGGEREREEVNRWGKEKTGKGKNEGMKEKILPQLVLCRTFLL